MKSNHYFFYKIAAIICLVGATSWWMFNGFSTPTMKAEQEEERENPQERYLALFNMLKDPATGTIPKDVLRKELEVARSVPAFKFKNADGRKTLPTITITEKGPNNYGGRTRALGFDIRNNGTNDVVISGGVSSGIFRSADGGASWTRVTPSGAIHNLTCIAQDTRSGSEDTWYAGTGEKIGGSIDGEGATYLGFGIWKSTDNGVTWTALTSTQSNLEEWSDDFDYISRIVVDPSNGAVLVAASETIKRSADGGSTWANVLGTDNAGKPGDLIYNSNSSTFYAAINGEATTSPGIWKSLNGTSWTQVRTEAELASGAPTEVKRIVLANVASTSGIVALSELDGTYSCSGGGTSEVSLQYFDGTTWADHTDNISNCSGGSAPTKNIATQDGYNMCITTKPDDANYVYFGGTEIYRYNLSTNVYEFIGGSQAGANSVNLHVDNHILMFDPNDNNIIWAGNDGGLRKTDVTGTIKTAAGDDNGYTWTSRTNNYVTYQYYDADINPTNGSEFVAGAAQDNAFSIHPTTAQALEVGPTADGTAVGIISGTDFSNYSIVVSWQNGGLARIDDGTEEYIQPDDKKQEFVSIILLDGDNTDHLYYPYTEDNSVQDYGLVRTRNATNIFDGTISSDPDNEWEDMTGVNTALGTNGYISVMEVSRNKSFSDAAYSASDANRKMYIGTSDGKVFRLADPAYTAASTAPTDISPTGMTGGGYVSDIAVNPYDDKEVLVTYSNYGVNSVWHTSDASVGSPTWTNIEGASGSAVELASARSAMIVKSSNTVVYLIGTSTGLYATDALSGATTTWTRLGTNSDIGLAVSIEMRLRTSDNKMVLGTHGNGLFMLSFPAPLPVELTSFTGKATERGNVLDWNTASEENNEGFDIQKSIDGKNFEKIGFVSGNGNSVVENNYSFTDNNASNAITYYRLKQLDVGGDFEYSKIVTIANENLNSKPLTLYPNPVKNNLTIGNGQGSATIRNAAGQRVLQLEINNNRQNVNVSSLPRGTYILTIRKKNGQSISRQFVK